MNRLVMLFVALSALCFCWRSGSGELPPNPAAAGEIFGDTTSLPPPPGSPKAEGRRPKVRTFAKACPECLQVCVSTNLVWSGGSQTERWGSVRFTCGNTNCEAAGEGFSEEIKVPIKKSAPMVEVVQ